MEMADRAEPLRLQSNRWPVDLVATGLVVSIGPAQITPRTAILACAAVVPRPDACGRGVKDLVESLLEETKSLNVVALVLRYEATNHLKITGDDVTLDIGQWATIYNVGGNYFRKNQNGKVGTANRFGQWVASEASAIRDALNKAAYSASRHGNLGTIQPPCRPSTRWIRVAQDQAQQAPSGTVRASLGSGTKMIGRRTRLGHEDAFGHT
jgi:hypothetical protein